MTESIKVAQTYNSDNSKINHTTSRIDQRPIIKPIKQRISFQGSSHKNPQYLRYRPRYLLPKDMSSSFQLNPKKDRASYQSLQKVKKTSSKELLSPRFNFQKRLHDLYKIERSLSKGSLSRSFNIDRPTPNRGYNYQPTYRRQRIYFPQHTRREYKPKRQQHKEYQTGYLPRGLYHPYSNYYILR